MLDSGDTQSRVATLERQKTHLAAILNQLSSLDNRFTWARAISSLSVVIGLMLAFIRQVSWLSVWVAGISFAAFTFIVFLHRRVDRSRLRFQLAFSFVSTQLARLGLNWESIPASIPVAVDPVHPFAEDLNILGDRSLHQLIDMATSLGGSHRLAGWLLNAIPDLEIIQQRHAILHELIPLNGFRSRLALKGRQIQAENNGRWDGERLLQVLSGPAASGLVAVLGLLLALTAMNAVLFVLSLGGLLPPLWIAGLVLYGFIYLAKYQAYRSLFVDTYILGKSLSQVKQIFIFLENTSYTGTPCLAQLCEPFTRARKRPSQFLRKFTWITIAAGVGNNPVFGGMINLLVPWNFFLAYILTRYKQDLYQPLQEWLNIWYELDALCSLANFAWLNPGYAFPHLLTQETPQQSGVFHAHQLGHPLIPYRTRVCNDFAIQSLGDVVIVTGSNMSGKSTFLRTIGINLFLVNAGGPVTSAEMNTLLFRPFTCIQVSDSLANGISYFYAEVRRLKQLLIELEKEDSRPVFYLIDEIYRGTNNEERRIGSQAYIHTLCQHQHIGIVSTHDLDLVNLSRTESRVVNYHFRENITNRRMTYDYRLRPGPCPTTNALKIMELEGLPVGPINTETG